MRLSNAKNRVVGCLLALSFLAQQPVQAALVTMQSQTLPFSFNPATILNGGTDVQTYTLQFQQFTVPKYMGVLNSLSVQTNYNVALTFQALQRSNFGESWPIVYRFSYSPNSAYAAGALGTPVDIPVTYQCFGPNGCSPGGQPFPDARVSSSFNLDKDQLGLRSLIGRAGGPLVLNELTVMGGGIPAVLTSKLTGDVTATATYTAQYPPEIKQRAELLGTSLGGISAALSGLGILIDPGRTLGQAGAYFISLAVGHLIDKIDAAIGDQSASGAAAYSAFSNILSGIQGIAKIFTSMGVPTNPAGLLLGAITLALDGFTYVANKIAADPPDTNFKEVASIQSTDLSFLTSSLPDLPIFAAGKKLLGDILTATQILTSILVSMERAQGAEAAGDQFWLLQQLQQLSDALIAYNDISIQLKNDWDAFMAALAGDGVTGPTNVTVNGSDLVDALNKDDLSAISEFIFESGLSTGEVLDILAEINLTTFSDPTGAGFAALSSIGDIIYQTGDLTLQIRQDQPNQSVPEPGAGVLLGLGILILTITRYKRKSSTTRLFVQKGI